MRQHFKALRRGLDGHAMAHPRVLIGGGAVEQTFRLVDEGLGLAIFAKGGLVDIRAQGIGHGLEAVADAQYGNAGLEQFLVHTRRARLEHRSRTTGKMMACGSLASISSTGMECGTSSE